MNYIITFSTYVNKTGDVSTTEEVETYLVTLAKKYNIQGFSLTEQLGYWAGETETSYILTLLDSHKRIAVDVAEEVKKHYQQDAVILKPDNSKVYFI